MVAVLSQVRLVCYPSCDDEQAERPPFGDGTKNVNETIYACHFSSTKRLLAVMPLHNNRYGIAKRRYKQARSYPFRSIMMVPLEAYRTRYNWFSCINKTLT